VQIPHVTRQEYTLLDISEDGFVSARPGAGRRTQSLVELLL